MADPARLGGLDLAFHEGPSNTDLVPPEVDVAPFQGDQLAGAQSTEDRKLEVVHYVFVVALAHHAEDKFDLLQQKGIRFLLLNLGIAHPVRRIPVDDSVHECGVENSPQDDEIVVTRLVGLPCRAGECGGNIREDDLSKHHLPQRW